MALIPCPDCNKDVSDTAPACIHCGRIAAERALAPVFACTRCYGPAPAGRLVCAACDADKESAAARPARESRAPAIAAVVVFMLGAVALVAYLVGGRQADKLNGATDGRRAPPPSAWTQERPKAPPAADVEREAEPLEDVSLGVFTEASYALDVMQRFGCANGNSPPAFVECMAMIGNRRATRSCLDKWRRIKKAAYDANGCMEQIRTVFGE